MAKKKIPTFKTWEEEAEFWDSHDTTDYFDDEDETDVLILGGPKSEVLNLRIEPQVKAQLERYARLDGVEMSDMLRDWIYRGIEELIDKHSGTPKSGGSSEDRLISRIGDIVEHRVGEVLSRYEVRSKKQQS